MLTTIMVTYVIDRDSVESISAPVGKSAESTILSDLTETLERWGHNPLAAYRLILDDTLDYHDPSLSTITPIAVRKMDITGDEYWAPLSGW